MTKWERIFKSHHPKAIVESRRGNDRQRYYLVRRERTAFMPSGDGPSKAKAWADACQRLGLMSEVKP